MRQEKEELEMDVLVREKAMEKVGKLCEAGTVARAPRASSQLSAARAPRTSEGCAWNV